VTTPAGAAVFASSPHGICWLDLASNATTPAIERLRSYWDGATFRHHDADAAAIARQALTTWQDGGSVPLHVRGSDFRYAVWSALCDIPHGTTLTYGELAVRIARPRAARAVGSAAGANVIGLLIPCHRLLPADASAGRYRWGAELKRQLLAAEGAGAAQNRTPGAGLAA